MSRIRKAGILLAICCFLGFTLQELNHFCHYGHLVLFGLHADVVVSTSDELLGVDGTGKIYHASVTNYGILPTAMVVCDYQDSGIHETMVNYIVERWDRQSGRWKSVPEWDDYGSRLFCRPSFEVTETHRIRLRLWPGQRIRVGEGVPAQRGGFHVGDDGRFTIFLQADGNGSNVISPTAFRVDQQPKKGAIPSEVSH